MGELPTARLAELAEALAGARSELPATLLQAVQTAAQSRATSLTAEEFSTLARSFAACGVLKKSLFEAHDVEACLTRPLRPGAVAGIAWSMTIAEVNSPAAWVLVGASLDSQRAQLKLMPSLERALLFEALVTRKLLHAPWKEGSAAAAICADEDWRSCWREHQPHIVPPSAHGDAVASMLKELGISAERDTEGDDGLYTMAFHLSDRNIVIDLLATPPRHAASGRSRGDLTLRHRVWSAAGRSVLAVPDGTWAQLAQQAAASASHASVEEAASAAAERQRAWLQERVDSIGREDLLDETKLQADTREQLKGAPIGPGGLNADALKLLQQQPDDVRQRSVSKFLTSWQQPNVNNVSGWMIGIVRQEEKAGEKEQLAAVLRPAEGWNRESGRAILDAKLGEKVSGTVVNTMQRRVWVDAGFSKDVSFTTAKPGLFSVGDKLKDLEVVAVDAEKAQVEVKLSEGFRKSRKLVEETKVGDTLSGTVTSTRYGRVWVDAGFTKDISFTARPGRFNPGDRLEGLEVVSVDAEKSWVHTKLTDNFRKHRQQPPAGGPRAKAAPAKPARAPARAPKEEAEAEAGADGDKAKEDQWDAARRRPEIGWQHQGGRPLGEFHVGQVVGGPVTNVLHERVWIDVGAEKDASFWSKEGEWKIGDVVKKVEISSINLKKGHIQVQSPATQ